MKNKKKIIIYLLVCFGGSFINVCFMPQEFKYLFGFLVGCIAFSIIGVSKV